MTLARRRAADLCASGFIFTTSFGADFSAEACVAVANAAISSSDPALRQMAPRLFGAACNGGRPEACQQYARLNASVDLAVAERNARVREAANLEATRSAAADERRRWRREDQTPLEGGGLLPEGSHEASIVEMESAPATGSNSARLISPNRTHPYPVLQRSFVREPPPPPPPPRVDTPPRPRVERPASHCTHCRAD